MMSAREGESHRLRVHMDEVRRMQQDPVRFIREILGGRPWGKQVEIVESVRDNRFTIVPSCHGAGKTNIAASIGVTWLATRPYSTVITTAPTARQVNELLWKEIRKAYSGSLQPIGGELLPKAAKLVIDDDWLMMGFSTDDPVNFQGWHSRGGVLVILDEAPGVNPEIYDAIRGVLVGPDDRFLGIGNPVEPSGPFYDLAQSGNANVIHISAYDVPNVIEGRIVIPGLATREWVEECKKEWGEKSPMFASRVLGEFPDTDDRALVPLSWIDAAEHRWQALEEKDAWGAEGEPWIGVDVARLGDDKTCLASFYPLQGIREIMHRPKQDLMKTAGDVLHFAEQTGSREMRIDADGIGAGVFDRLEEVVDGISREAVEMRGGMKADDPLRYMNRRAEWYWQLRSRLDPDFEGALALPPNNALRGQLSAIRWSLTSKGLIKIESKDDMLKRGMKSPDEADAVAYAAAVLELDQIGALAALARM